MPLHMGPVQLRPGAALLSPLLSSLLLMFPTLPLHPEAALLFPLLMFLTPPLPTLQPTLHPLLPHQALQEHARKTPPLPCHYISSLFKLAVA